MKQKIFVEIGSIHTNQQGREYRITGKEKNKYICEFVRSGYKIKVPASSALNGAVLDLTPIGVGQSYRNSRGQYYRIFDRITGTRYLKIKFLETGFVTTSEVTAIRTGCVRDYIANPRIIDVGMKRTTIFGDEYIILEKVDMGRYENNDKKRFYRCRFVKSGYERLFSYSEILANNMLDKNRPTIYKYGIVGSDTGLPVDVRAMYFRKWRHMIIKHHNTMKNNILGYTVCERWLRFDNFVKDIVNIKGFDKDLIMNGHFALYCTKGTEYNIENCEFLKVGSFKNKGL